MLQTAFHTWSLNLPHRSLNYDQINNADWHPVLNQHELKIENHFLFFIKSNGTEANHCWKVISNNERSLDWCLLKQYLNAESVASPQEKKKKKEKKRNISQQIHNVRLGLWSQITCCSQQPLLCSIKLHKSLPWLFCHGQNKPGRWVALREADGDVRMKWCHTNKNYGRGDSEADVSEAKSCCPQMSEEKKKQKRTTTNNHQQKYM